MKKHGHIKTRLDELRIVQKFKYEIKYKWIDRDIEIFADNIFNYYCKPYESMDKTGIIK